MNSQATRFRDLLQPYRQDRMAEALGVGEATVWTWYHGRSLPRRHLVRRIAEFLKIDQRALIEIIAEERKQRDLELAEASS
ncbi:MAG: helix-turn-helix domain-containing protein [Candidatus Tyrphobacter sp.]